MGEAGRRAVLLCQLLGHDPLPRTDLESLLLDSGRIDTAVVQYGHLIV